MKLTNIASAVLVLSAATTVSAQTAPAAGKVLIVAGSATVERAGRQTPLIAGSSVESGDTLSVGDKSTLQVRFTDESVVALRANSQFKIENYRFDKNAETDRSLMGLLKGGMRTITGLIGKANNKNYLVQTATSTIGIRGTHFAVVSCNNDCSRADGTAESNGTYGSVTDGRISVSNTTGTTEFGQQDSFFVSTPDTPPVRLLVPPAVLADRGAASKGRAAASTSDQEDSSGLRSSGTGESTSPQLVVQRSPSIELNAGLTSTSPLSAPALTASLNSPKSTESNFVVFAFTELSGFMLPSGVSVTKQNAGTVFPSSPALSDPDLANAVISDAQSAAAAIGRFRVVSRSPAAAAYWYYVAPAASYNLGTHRAFGEAPVGAVPTFGIAQYNYVGGTTPTDNYGRAGAFSGTNLTMNFSSQTIQSQGAITINFSPNAAMNVTTQYTVPAQTFSMGAGFQTLTGVTCASCAGSTVGSVNGQFLGANRQGFAAGILVRNSQLTTVNTANAAGNVSVYARQ